MKLTIIRFCLLILALFISTTCFAKVKIGFTYVELETEFWVASHRKFTEKLTQSGAIFIEANAQENAERQLAQVQDFIDKGVDGIIVIPVGGTSVLDQIKLANEHNIPIVVYNRPPALRENNGIVIVANNEKIAEKTVDHLVLQASRIGLRVQPLIMIGSLKDPNSIGRRNGFYKAINKFSETFYPAIEVPTDWNTSTALKNLKEALIKHPTTKLIFSSSDFFYPQIKAVLQSMKKWHKIGDPEHIILGGFDGDTRACHLMKSGFVDATGVQDVFFEVNQAVEHLLKAIEDQDYQAKDWIYDEGFALTQENLNSREHDMWGCRLLQGDF